MIDVGVSRFIKLANVPPESVLPQLTHVLIDGERLMVAARGTRDFVVVTNRRVVVVTAQGITGKKLNILI